MLTSSHVLLKSSSTNRAADKFRAHRMLSKFKHSGQASAPTAQLAQSRMNVVHDYMKRRERNAKGEDKGGRGERKAFDKIYIPSPKIGTDLANHERTLRMQNAPIPGERAPIEVHNRQDPVDAMKYSDDLDRMQHAPPPEVYSDLMRRKVMAGQNWPAVPVGFEMQSKSVAEKEHESNMSPSALKTSTKVLYLLRKNIKACPSYLREQMDFAELMLCDVRASRRSTTVYIFWGTVTPAARYELEPILPKLNQWIKSVLIYARKEAGGKWSFPTVPNIMWVYDNGAMNETLPKALTRQLKNTMTHLNTSTDDRIKYLSKMDSLSARMKGVPWFMPYLWNKDNKALKQASYVRDASEVEKRKNKRNQALGGGTNYVR